FFFQAEDGIRDDLVTGVQTCAFRSLAAPAAPGVDRALPQDPPGLAPAGQAVPGRRAQAGRSSIVAPWHEPRLKWSHGPAASIVRSEERRVGKECRDRWSVYGYK